MTLCNKAQQGLVFDALIKARRAGATFIEYLEVLHRYTKKGVFQLKVEDLESCLLALKLLAEEAEKRPR